MPARRHSDPWVISLRDMLKTSLGSSWRVGEQSGKCKIDVRFQDKSRSVGLIPIPWKQAKAKDIQDAVLAVAQLVQSNYTLKEALETLYGKKKRSPAAITNIDGEQLAEIWNLYIKHKERTVKRSTIDGLKKSFRKLNPHIHEVFDAQQLLELATENLDSGSVTCKHTVQHLSAWLRWAVSKGYLDQNRWEPPAKESDAISDLIGKSETTPKQTIPIYDDEILELIESLKKNRELKTAEKYIYGIQLMSCYGLRPHEVELVEVDEVGRVMIGAGKTGERELYGLHPQWEQDWDLIQKIKDKHPLPRKDWSGYGETFRKYLINQQYWQELRKRRDTSKAIIRTYSFRNSWAWRCHTDPKYSNKISTRLAASLMGHRHKTHLDYYGKWTPNGSIRNQLNKLLDV